MTRTGIAGVIIAGGKGTRIGGGKPFLPFGGTTLIEAVIARVQPQVDHLALNLPKTAPRPAPHLPYLPDPLFADIGPLNGLLAGLNWLPQSCDWLASFPCDTPFLPRDLVARLAAARSAERPVVVAAGEQIHALCALWPRAGFWSLRREVEAGRIRAMREALALLDAVRLQVPADDPAFFNVNTPEDLAEADRLCRAGKTD